MSDETGDCVNEMGWAELLPEEGPTDCEEVPWDEGAPDRGPPDERLGATVGETLPAGASLPNALV